MQGSGFYEVFYGKFDCLMLEIVQQLRLSSAIDATRGDIQSLLQRLLIEVVSANYRYFLHERLTFAAEGYDQPETYCWPPLLANERQVSGLFAHALSSVCPVSRPEVGITRTRLKEKEDERTGEGSGRIDFFATHGQRSVALELKRTGTSTIADGKKWAVLKHQWKVVGDQAESALQHLRNEKFPHAVSVGLLVVRIMRSAFPRRDVVADMKAAGEAVGPLAASLNKQLRPDFLAVYRPPEIMQLSYGWGESGESTRIFPGVAFAATVRVKLAKGSKKK